MMGGMDEDGVRRVFQDGFCSVGDGIGEYVGLIEAQLCR